MSDSHDDRLRMIEREIAEQSVRVNALEAQNSAQWAELRAIRKEQREEYEKLAKTISDKTDSLSELITANKLAWSHLSSGGKAIAWILAFLFSLAGTITGIAAAVKKIFFDA